MTGENMAKMDFVAFISGLMYEGMMALGIVENPITKKAEKNLEHAQMVIDTIDMLKERTKGNLSVVEESKVDDILHQLRMGYVAVLEGKGPSSDEAPKADASPDPEKAPETEKVEENEK